MVKCLSYNHEAWVRFFRTHIKQRTKQKAMHAIYACNPSTREGKTGRPMNSMARHPSLLGQFQIRERTFPQTKMISPCRMTARLYICLFMHVYLDLRMHLNLYIDLHILILAYTWTHKPTDPGCWSIYEENNLMTKVWFNAPRTSK